jgi:pimeloyl-ACP methyl ester carboxylesterase
MRKNSTNVRSLKTALPRLGLRAGLQLMSALAPAATERWALSRFATPARNHHGGPKAPGGHRFTLPGRNGDLAAWDFGDGPTVLLAHGWSGHAAQMSAFVPALVAAGYHVVCFDQPAHGHSGGRRTNMLEFRDAVLTVGRRLGPLAGVIAHSLGATATLLALDRGLRADRLVLMAPPIDPIPFAWAFASHVGLPRARTEGLIKLLRDFLHADLGGRYAIEAAAATRDPLLVIHDQDDRAVPIEQGRALAEASPRAQLWPISGLGHNRMLADPAVVQTAVEFLRTGRVAARPVQPASSDQASDQRMLEQLSLTAHMLPIEQTLQASSTNPSQSSSTPLPQTSRAIG